MRQIEVVAADVVDQQRPHQLDPPRALRLLQAVHVLGEPRHANCLEHAELTLEALREQRLLVLGAGHEVTQRVLALHVGCLVEGVDEWRVTFVLGSHLARHPLHGAHVDDALLARLKEPPQVLDEVWEVRKDRHHGLGCRGAPRVQARRHALFILWPVHCVKEWSASGA